MAIFQSEVSEVIKKLANKSFGTQEERDEMLARVEAADGLRARELVWMLFRPDRAIRESGARAMARAPLSRMARSGRKSIQTSSRARSPSAASTRASISSRSSCVPKLLFASFLMTSLTSDWKMAIGGEESTSRKEESHRPPGSSSVLPGKR